MDDYIDTVRILAIGLLSERPHIDPRTPYAFLHQVGPYGQRAEKRHSASLTWRIASAVCITMQLHAQIRVTAHLCDEFVQRPGRG